MEEEKEKRKSISGTEYKQTLSMPSSSSSPTSMPMSMSIPISVSQPTSPLIMSQSNPLYADHHRRRSSFNPFADLAKRRRKRREAIRQLKIQQTSGHQLVMKFFSQPTCCSVCNEFLWGFGKQGFQCKLCGCVLHEKCALQEKIPFKCSNNSTFFLEEINDGTEQEIEHKFSEKAFMAPTFCHHCGQLIFGFYKQGVRCEACEYECHKKCVKNAPKNCLNNKGRRSSKVHENGNDEKFSLKKTTTNIERLMQRAVGEALMVHSNLSAEIAKNFSTTPPQKDSHNSQITPPQSPSEITCSTTTISPSRPSGVTIDDFTLLKTLGKGSFGKVYLCATKNSVDYYAIKAMRKDVILEQDDFKYALMERDVYVLGNYNQFLARLVCSFQNEDYLFMVMEYICGGDLFYHLELAERFSEMRVRFYAAEIICAFDFLHSHGIIYRDLKLDNVVLDIDGHIKLTDFGMCTKVDPNYGVTFTFCGTPEYLAPEVVQGKPYTFTVDFWSLGVLTYEMLCSYPPFHGDQEQMLFTSICDDKVVYPGTLSTKVRSLMDGLLEKEPLRRLGSPRAAPIRKHAFFADIDWVQLELGQVQPPYKPHVRAPNDVSNFDPVFTEEEPILTKIDQNLRQTINHNLFKGFSFVEKSFKP